MKTVQIIKQLTFFFLTLTILAGCKEKEAKKMAGQEAEEMAAVAEEETKDEWAVLFDGTSFDGWKGYLTEGVPEQWKLEDGAMVFYPPKERKKGESYNINTVKEYTDFVLSLEWRIAEGGNSGVFWGIKEDEKYNQPYETGPEIQVLDNEKHPDAKAGTTHQAGALYDMVAPSEDVTKPVGEWNSMVIMVDHRGKTGSVTLNDKEILTFPVGNDSWNTMVSKSKFADWESFGKFTTGKIGLQDHGDVVAYRNIKIKEL